MAQTNAVKEIFIVRERENDIIIDTYDCIEIYYSGNKAYKELVSIRWDIAKKIKETYSVADFEKLKMPKPFDKEKYYTKSIKGRMKGHTQYDNYATSFDYDKVFFKYDDAKRELIMKYRNRIQKHKDKIAWHNQQLITARSQYRAIATKKEYRLFGK